MFHMRNIFCTEGKMSGCIEGGNEFYIRTNNFRVDAKL